MNIKEHISLNSKGVVGSFCFFIMALWSVPFIIQSNQAKSSAPDPSKAHCKFWKYDILAQYFFLTGHCETEKHKLSYYQSVSLESYEKRRDKSKKKLRLNQIQQCLLSFVIPLM